MIVTIWTTLRSAIYWTLGGIEAGRWLARKIRRAGTSVDDTEPIPLTHRDVERRAQQIRCASRPMGSKPPPDC